MDHREGGRVFAHGERKGWGCEQEAVMMILRAMKAMAGRESSVVDAITSAMIMLNSNRQQKANLMTKSHPICPQWSRSTKHKMPATQPKNKQSTRGKGVLDIVLSRQQASFTQKRK